MPLSEKFNEVFMPIEHILHGASGSTGSSKSTQLTICVIVFIVPDCKFSFSPLRFLSLNIFPIAPFPDHCLLLTLNYWVCRRGVFEINELIYFIVVKALGLRSKGC